MISRNFHVHVPFFLSVVCLCIRSTFLGGPLFVCWSLRMPMIAFVLLSVTMLASRTILIRLAETPNANRVPTTAR